MARFWTILWHAVGLGSMLMGAVCMGDSSTPLPNTFPGDAPAGTLAQQDAIFANCNSSALTTTATSLFSTYVTAQSGVQRGTSIFGSMAGQLSCTAGGAATSLSTVCPEASAGFTQGLASGMGYNNSMNDLQCTDILRNPSALTPLERSLDQQLAQIQNEVCTLQCRESKLNLMKNQLNCITDALQSLNNSIGSLSSAFQANLNAAQKQVRDYDAQIDDADAQINDVSTRLGGDGNGNGLVALQGKMQSLASTLPGKITTIQNTSTTISQSQALLKKQIQNQQMSLTNACLYTQKIANLQCVKNGPAVTVQEYLKCAVSANQRSRGTNGQLVQTGLQQQTAGSLGDRMDSLLLTIQGGMASGSQVSVSGSSEDGGSYNLNSWSDIESQYGGDLSSFSIGNQTALSFFKTAFQSCYHRAENTAAQDTNILQRQNAIQIDQANQQQAITELETEMQETYAQVTGAMGTAHNLDYSSCQGLSTSQQISCLQNTQTLMNQVLNGTGSQFQGTLQLRGTLSGADTTIQYRGINDLVAQLQQQKANLGQKKSTVNLKKEQLIKQANADAQSYVKRIAGSLSPASAQIQNRFNEIVKGLNTMGLQSNSTLAGTTPEQLQSGSDGLPDTPQSMAHLIGGGMSPVLGDLNGGGLSSLQSELNQAAQSLASQASTQIANQQMLQSQKDTLQRLEENCKHEEGANHDSNLAELADALENTNCHGYSGCHEPQFQDHLQTLSSSILQIVAPGIQRTTLQQLSTGVSGLCRLKNGAPTQATYAQRNFIPRTRNIGMNGQMFGMNQNFGQNFGNNFNGGLGQDPNANLMQMQQNIMLQNMMARQAQPSDRVHDDSLGEQSVTRQADCNAILSDIRSKTTKAQGFQKRINQANGRRRSLNARE